MLGWEWGEGVVSEEGGKEGEAQGKTELWSPRLSPPCLDDLTSNDDELVPSLPFPFLSLYTLPAQHVPPIFPLAIQDSQLLPSNVRNLSSDNVPLSLLLSSSRSVHSLPSSLRPRPQDHLLPQGRGRRSS